MVEVLISLNSLDLYQFFHEEDIDAHDVVNLGIEELEEIGLESEIARRFLQEVERKKKEQEGKDALKNYLTAMDSFELYDTLHKHGILADRLSTLNHATLKETGLTLGKRRRLLDKIQSYITGI